MFRYDKQIEAIQPGQTQGDLRLRLGQTLGFPESDFFIFHTTSFMQKND